MLQQQYEFMKWLDCKPVLFEMVKCTQKREFAFLKGINIRALNLFYVDQFNKILKLSDYTTKRPNMYVSVAQLDFIPQFTYNLSQRSKDTIEWFKKEYHKHIIAYDLFLDFDSKEGEDLSVVHSEVKEFKTWLDEWKLPYYSLFSGNKGFQIVIPYEYLPKELNFSVNAMSWGEKGSVYEWTKIVSERLKNVFSLSHLDLANSGVLNRLKKCSYSLVGDNVALPLNDYDFSTWNIGKMHYNYVLKRTLIKNRGLLLRGHGLQKEELQGNLMKFIKEFKLYG